MADKELGMVESRNGAYRVSWDDRTGKVYVKKLSGWLSSWVQCEATAKTAADAMDVAAAYVHYQG